MKMKIGIDIDDVIRDFVGKLKEIYFREYPSHKLIKEDVWNMSLWFPIEKEIYKFAFETYAKEIYIQARTYENALEFLIKLRKNHELRHLYQFLFSFSFFKKIFYLKYSYILKNISINTNFLFFLKIKNLDCAGF